MRRATKQNGSTSKYDSSKNEIFSPSSTSSMTQHAGIAKMFFRSSLAHPQNHLGILHLKENHYGLLTHPVIAAELRQHYNMARSMAALSLSFIILVTPWTMKEVAVSCTGTKLSPLWDFLITCLGMSYVLWNPFLFAIFNVRFQMAVREFIREEVLCKRRDQCCSNHHQASNGACKPAMATLLTQIRPTSMMLMNPSAASAGLIESKSHTLPASSSRFHHHHFSSAVALENGHGGQPNNEEATLAQNFIYPLNGHHRAMSAPRLLQASQASNTERDLREKYWGEILERSMSHATLNHWNARQHNSSTTSS